VMRRVVNLYGHGLERGLEHARGAGADPTALAERIARDDLLASLLLVHGLHPMTTEERLQRSLRALRRELDVDDDGLALVSLDGPVLHLRVRGKLGNSEMSPMLAESLIRRVIDSSVPEVKTVRIDHAAPRPDPDLRSRRATSP
jgi:hypothetical protein